jgi:hypothetical protein
MTTQATRTICEKPGYSAQVDRPGAVTHMQSYDAYVARGPSGFSGHGTALIDSLTGEVLSKAAFPVELTDEQEQIERAYAADREAEHRAEERAENAWLRAAEYDPRMDDPREW